MSMAASLVHNSYQQQSFKVAKVRIVWTLRDYCSVDVRKIPNPLCT